MGFSPVQHGHHDGRSRREVQKSRSFSPTSWNRNEDDAEADVIVAETGGVAVSGRRTAELGKIVPTAAPIHAERAAVAREEFRIAGIPAFVCIAAPLPDIPAHIVQPELVRLLLRHRMRLFPGVAFMPRDLIEIIAAAVCEVVTFFAAPRRVLFPFSSANTFDTVSQSTK